MNETTWHIKQLKRIRGKIRVLTGLHIGGSPERMEIGGVDNPIIRDPANGEPYIPGSSLKGKMRSLMEWHLGKLQDDGKVHDCRSPDCPICRVFGCPASDKVGPGPTRLIVRDCMLSEEARENYLKGAEIAEIKHENSINRITAMANPRPLERVLPGVTFDLDLVYRVIDTGDDGRTDTDYFQKVVLKALALVESDFLGGCGSRGCGKVRFEDLKDEKGRKLSLPSLES
ncbi:MAG: type III-A CRISPR-associated RAMP protein Csm3 [Sedimentisphaerales bacterium]|jgi:CRISPR-associated protein Csm3|nr:type III-A CRISPR-associated RAMP protein Csm3 [Sedimentisphaerales bacterium]